MIEAMCNKSVTNHFDYATVDARTPSTSLVKVTKPAKWKLHKEYTYKNV